jgi:MFS family permease
LLWIGQVTSLLGDQFHSIAAAWLVLKLTGDPLALGAVLAVGGIPRAIFTVIGGAISDRISPRRLMIFSDVFRLLLSALLATQVFTGTLQVWMIYVYSFIGGCLGGLFSPASMSITPRLVPTDSLQAGNSVMQGSTQLIGFIGPAAAGAIIAAFKGSNIGVGAAIAFDALTFIASVVTLMLIRSTEVSAVQSVTGARVGVLASIRDGIVYLVKDPSLRAMFLLIAVANLAFGGPVIVGVPYLASTRFPEGAAAYGFIISGYAGGNLLGIVLSGALPRLTRRSSQVLMTLMFSLFGLGMVAMGWIPFTWLATADLFILGTLNGYLSILLITGLQRNTPAHMLGRLMSMVLLANLALIPLSQAVSGAILSVDVVLLFLISAGLLLACAIYLALPKTSALISAILARDEPDEQNPS